MQSIKVLSQNMNPLLETTSYLSCIFTRSFFGIGEIQLVVHKDSPAAAAIHKNCLIALTREKVGIIKHREILLDEKGKATENWLFKGPQLKGIANQRVSLPPSHTAYDRRTANAETLMYHYMINNMINPTDAKRMMERVVLAENMNRGKSFTWQSRFKVLSEELEKIGMAGNLGWDIVLDTENNKFIFKALEGRDLTVDNPHGNSPVFFAPEFGNLKTLSFVDSDYNYKNYGYVGGQGEGVERTIVEIGDSVGMDRHEMFIDARDIGGEDEANNQLSPAEERALLTERGQQRLNEYQNEMFLEAEIMSPVKQTTYHDEFAGYASPYQPIYNKKKKTKVTGPFIYEKDYELGDIVTVMKRDWGVMSNQRITELTEIYEPTGFKLDATFGIARPTLLTKIKQQYAQFEAEVKR